MNGTAVLYSSSIHSIQDFPCYSGKLKKTLRRFAASQYGILLLQEHGLDKKGCQKASNYVKSLHGDLRCKFSARPEADRVKGGTVIVAKPAVTGNDYKFETVGTIGAATVLITSEWRMYSVYAPQQAQKRVDLFKTLRKHANKNP